ncbi:MAG: SH3 domain-containing protein [Burkholderiaceae bacterium]|jgi:uncharacterized protein YraI|nr:SH3 domain-containing protein [Burkholderiaceae bacterium]
MSAEQIKGWLRNTAIVAAIAMPLAAAAQQTVLNGACILQAGPGPNYPAVAQLGPGTPATVMGCVGGYGWCDVVVPGGLRGWMSSDCLGYSFQGLSVPLFTLAAIIGVPIITFSIDNYWNSYYRDRPWYVEPRWWGGRRPPPPPPGWRPSAPPMPAWRPHQPPANWRPPQGPGMGFAPGPRPHPPAMRPIERPRPPDTMRPMERPYPGAGRPMERPQPGAMRPMERPQPGAMRPMERPRPEGRPPPPAGRPGNNGGPPQDRGHFDR